MRGCGAMTGQPGKRQVRRAAGLALALCLVAGATLGQGRGVVPNPVPQTEIGQGESLRNDTGIRSGVQPDNAGRTNGDQGNGRQNARAAGATAGGLSLTFGLASELRADDNYALNENSSGTAFIFDNTLSFGLLSQTLTDTLRLDASGVVRLGDFPETGFDSGFEDPTLSLDYIREAADSRLTFDANYRDADLAFLDPLAEADLVTGDLIVDTGTRLTYGAGLRLEIGLDAPFGANFNARRQVREYTDTTAPELFDTTTDTVGAGLRFRYSGTGEARLNLSQEDYTAKGTRATDRVTRNITLGVAQDLTPVLSLDASIGLTDLDRGAGSPSGSEDGMTGGVGLIRTLTNGTAGVRFDQTFGVNGERSTLRFSREIELPAGSLSASLGGTKGETGGTEVVARLAYAQDLPRGSFRASVERDVTTNSLDEDVLGTRIGLDYRTDINSLSGLSLSLDYAITESAGDSAASDRDAATFAATYTRELTEDVDLSAGYRHRLRKDNGDTARSNAVFLTLSRKVTIRP